MKLCLLDADYINEKESSIIRLFCKDRNGKTVACLDYNFEPYFYILPKRGKEKGVKKEVEKIKSIRIKKVEIVERVLFGEKRKFVKVYCFLSTDVPKVRDIVKRWKEVEEEYEYSINFYRRYLIDHQIEGWIDVEGEEEKKNYQTEKVIKIKKIKHVKSDDYYMDLNINNWLVEWRKGSLIDLKDNSELMYFHFIKSKNQDKFLISPFKDQTIFRISQNGILS